MQWQKNPYGLHLSRFKTIKGTRNALICNEMSLIQVNWSRWAILMTILWWMRSQGRRLNRTLVIKSNDTKKSNGKIRTRGFWGRCNSWRRSIWTINLWLIISKHKMSFCSYFKRRNKKHHKKWRREKKRPGFVFHRRKFNKYTRRSNL